MTLHQKRFLLFLLLALALICNAIYFFAVPYLISPVPPADPPVAEQPDEPSDF